jgi:hypothetical protein
MQIVNIRDAISRIVSQQRQCFDGIKVTTAAHYFHCHSHQRAKMKKLLCLITTVTASVALALAWYVTYNLIYFLDV